MLNADAAHSVSVSHGSAGGQVGNAAPSIISFYSYFCALVFGHGNLTEEPLDSENSYFSIFLNIISVKIDQF